MNDSHLINPEDFFIWDKMFLVKDGEEVLALVLGLNKREALDLLAEEGMLDFYLVEQREFDDTITWIDGKAFDLSKLIVEEIPKPEFSITNLINRDTDKILYQLNSIREVAQDQPYILLRCEKIESLLKEEHEKMGKSV